MRVLNLCSVPWYNACAHYAFTVGLALREKGHAVTFGGLKGSPLLDKARAAGFEVLDSLHFKGFNPARAAGSLLKLKRFIARNSIGLVITHRGEDRTFAGLFKKVPHISVRADIRRPRKTPFSRWLNRKAIDCHVVPSDFMRAYYPAGASVRVIPQPLAERHFLEYKPAGDLRQTLGLEKHHILAGIIARLDPVKGHAHVMDAANRLAERPEIKFLVSGETFGVKPEALKSQLSEKARTNVFFIDRATDVRELLPAIDIGIIASTGSEAVCRVALEMMAYGLPIVGTDVHSIPECVSHRYGGYIVKPGSGRALASAIGAFARSAALRKSFGEFNRRRLDERFSLPAFSEVWHQLCLEVARD